MERNMKVTVRLSELELAKLDALCFRGSRDGYFRNLLAAMGEQRAAIHEAAIIGFREVAKAAVEDGNRAQAKEYRKLIEEYETQITILRRRGE